MLTYNIEDSSDICTFMVTINLILLSNTITARFVTALSDIINIKFSDYIMDYLHHAMTNYGVHHYH